MFAWKFLLISVAVFAVTTAEDIQQIKKRRCDCTREYVPVCASDGNTYPNKCMMGCYNEKNDLKFEHYGPCGSKHEFFTNQCSCNRVKREVCGTDGITYLNPCWLKCAAATNPSLKKAYDGPCKT
uniref:Venom Kazal domain protein 2 n=1 Tax=Pristhesancus plagipennis TaxID=1955184 RepID=A0A2K8JM17_PRIPG|nr:venom Kazal domain protein 2 [Pristhesancus plagipennis]